LKKEEILKTPKTPKTTLLVAWTVILLASSLPMVILQEIFGQTVSADQQAVMSLSVILVALLATLVWRSLRGLWSFLVLFLVLVVSQWLVYNRIDELAKYPVWLHHPSFNISMLAEQSLNLMVTLLVIITLLLMRKKPKDFFLAKGDIDAPAEPIRWLGVKEGDRWNTFGAWLCVFISLGMLIFLVIAGRPPLDIIIQVLPFVPAILLAAALNAFTEEVTYKASFLSVLESPVGPRQAVYMVAVFFGLLHYYGIPYGVIGVLLAAFMGWLLAKSMQETRGLFWAWFIHFLQDVWIFAFLAIGSILPGGG
jgi:membrane protease YdiL (CAAX protease family)